MQSGVVKGDKRQEERNGNNRVRRVYSRKNSTSFSSLCHMSLFILIAALIPRVDPDLLFVRRCTGCFPIVSNQADQHIVIMQQVAGSHQEGATGPWNLLAAIGCRKQPGSTLGTDNVVGLMSPLKLDVAGHCMSHTAKARFCLTVATHRPFSFLHSPIVPLCSNHPSIPSSRPHSFPFCPLFPSSLPCIASRWTCHLASPLPSSPPHNPIKRAAWPCSQRTTLVHSQGSLN